MDGGSSSVPLSPPPHVYFRLPAPPPKVHFDRPPAPTLVVAPRAPGPRAAPKPPMPPPSAAQAPPSAPGAKEPPPAAAMRPPPPPQLTSSAAVLPPPAPQAVPKGQQKATPPSDGENNGRGISKAEIKVEETVQGHDEASPTAPTKAIKRPKKVKASRHTSDASGGGTVEGYAGPLYSSNHCRYDSSLSLLTKKFVNLLQEAEDGTIDLNKAAEALEVQKRRIYDITNVLEGVDLIEKSHKNMVRWKGFDISKPKEKECQISVLKEELESLYKEDDRLENEIREAQDKLEALVLDEDKKKLLYVLTDDINNIPHFKGETLIAIKAPRGTSIEVPDPNVDLILFKNLNLKEMHYQMILRSSMGPIDCYLIRSHSNDGQEICNPYHQVMPDNSELVVTTGSAQALQHMDCDTNPSVQQMDCDPIEAVQRMDCDQSQALKKGGSNAACTHTTAPSRKHENMSDIVRIVPSDANIHGAGDRWIFRFGPIICLSQKHNRMTPYSIVLVTANCNLVGPCSGPINQQSTGYSVASRFCTLAACCRCQSIPSMVQEDQKLQ